MTSQQELKFDEMYRTVLEIQGDMKVYKNQQENHFDAIVEIVKSIEKLRQDMDNYKADRNKVTGISWFAGGLMALGGLIYEIAKHL